MSIAAKCTCFKRPSGWCSGDDCPKAIKQNDDKQLIEINKWWDKLTIEEQDELSEKYFPENCADTLEKVIFIFKKEHEWINN